MPESVLSPILSSEKKSLAFDLILKAEPLWAMPAVGFLFVAVLMDIPYSWLGLAGAVIAYPLRWLQATRRESMPAPRSGS